MARLTGHDLTLAKLDFLRTLTEGKTMPARHDIAITNIGDNRYIATCRSCAVGIGGHSYEAMDMWVASHCRHRCQCKHMASSHGYGLASWEYGNTGCGTCKGTNACKRFRRG